MVAGQGDWWSRRATGRRFSVLRTFADPAPGRAKQTCWCREAKHNVAKPSNYAHGHVAGQWGRWECGWWGCRTLKYRFFSSNLFCNSYGVDVQ